MLKRSIWLAILIPFLGACATVPSGPTVMVLPGGGKTFEEFQADDGLCRQWAFQQSGTSPGQAATQSGVTSAIIGTALGAAAGAAIGAAVGNPALGAAAGAGGGLLAWVTGMTVLGWVEVVVCSSGGVCAAALAVAAPVWA